MLHCLVIDDEPLAREGLREYIDHIDFLHLVGICENPLEAIQVMDANPVDLLYLDVQMPKITGLEFLRSLTDPPLVIMTTAYPSFALEGFELNVLDYLVKPITFERFFTAAQKAKQQMALIRNSRPAANSSSNYFFIKCDGKFEKIGFAELYLIESLQNYVVLHTDRGKFTALMALKNIAAELPEDRFLQIHKSFIIALNRIENLDGNRITIGGRQVPVSRANRDTIMQMVKQHLIKGSRKPGIKEL